jgi:DNA polymerase (family 10)
MDKQAIGRVLNEIATLLELRGEDGFRARAFQVAARAIEELEEDVAALAASGALKQVRGVGPTTARVIRELVETGASGYHEELRREVPAGLLELLHVPGLGPKRIHTLHTRLGITSLDELERAARDGRLAGLPGFGARTQEKVLEGIAYRRRTAGRRRRPEALALAAELLDWLRADASVTRAEPAGALRRGLETVDGVDVVAAVEGDAAPLLARFLALHGAAAGERTGPDAARVRLADGFEARLRCVAPGAFGAAWLVATGSEAHVRAVAERAAARGLRLDRDGLWDGARRVDAPEEAAVYRALGLDDVAPELREGEGEVEAAGAGLLPRLVTYADLKGCFHVHTTYSDGRATLKEMARAALARGWRYLGIADHSQAAAYAGGLRVEDIARQHDEIDAWNAEHGHELWLFKGVEADILADGRLDYAALEGDVLGRFDYVVGSVHSIFGLSQAAMTERILRALEDPHLTFLGHLTGRILLERDGYAVDVEAVIEAAAERGVGIEINANPSRLDLDWRWWRAASARGVRAAINPDAHDAEGLDDVHYGVTVARKGWLGVGNVVNAWGVEEVKAYFGKRRGGA